TLPLPQSRPPTAVFVALLAWHRGYIDDTDVERVINTADRLGLAMHHPLFADTDMLLRSLDATAKHRGGDQNPTDRTPAQIARAARTMALLADRTPAYA